MLDWFNTGMRCDEIFNCSKSEALIGTRGAMEIGSCGFDDSFISILRRMLERKVGCDTMSDARTVNLWRGGRRVA